MRGMVCRGTGRISHEAAIRIIWLHTLLQLPATGLQERASKSMRESGLTSPLLKFKMNRGEEKSKTGNQVSVIEFGHIGKRLLSSHIDQREDAFDTDNHDDLCISR